LFSFRLIAGVIDFYAATGSSDRTPSVTVVDRLVIDNSLGGVYLNPMIESTVGSLSLFASFPSFFEMLSTYITSQPSDSGVELLHGKILTR
jgi:hypothetical protein